MNFRMTAAAMCAVIGWSVTGLAVAQTAWTQITRGDLQPCVSVLEQAHAKELAYWDKEIARACKPGTPGTDAFCNSVKNGKREAQSYEDVTEWYQFGQTHCEDGTYPCFGSPTFNVDPGAQQRASTIEQFKKYAAEGTVITPALDFWDSAHKADNCAAGVWLKKAGYSGSATATTKAAASPATSPPVASAGANDPVFQSKLKTSNADELLALVNELLTTGNIDVAKLARNALLQRFPDSPLVPVVAKLISSASQPTAPVALIAAPPQSSGAASNERLRIDSEASLVAAFARLGVTLTKSGNTGFFLPPNGGYLVSLGDCRDGKCMAIQLKANYNLLPAVTFARINTFNAKNLYGRATWNDTTFTYDMVIRMGDSTIAETDLADAVRLFPAVAGEFYKSITAP